MPPLQIKTLALLGGLQDSKPEPDASDLQELYNMVPLRGRFAVRAPAVSTVQLLSSTSDETPAHAVDSICMICYGIGKMYVTAYRAGSIKKVYLYRLSTLGLGTGGYASPIATVWSSVNTEPRISMCEFQGGDVDTGIDRLYISDVDQLNPTVYWDTTAIIPVTEDLNDDGAKEPIYFSLVYGYQQCLWGTGFLCGGADFRPELARFSRPGLIAELEPAVTNNASREWWNVDQRAFTKRGDAIAAIGYAGGSCIVYKRHETNALYGYDSDSWARTSLDDRLGAVGYRSVATTNGGLSFAWSDRGPTVTDGQSVKFIGQDILRHIQERGFTENVVAEFSPDDGLVYFCVPAVGTGVPNMYFAYDSTTAKYVEGAWLALGGQPLTVNALVAVSDLTLPAPLGVPASLVATGVSDAEIDLTWTNADTAMTTSTEIFRGTSTGFTLDGTTLIGTVASGVASYADTVGLSGSTQYFYRIRHVRNGQNGTATAESLGTTFLSAPGITGTLKTTTPPRTTITLAVNNTVDGSTIIIEQASPYLDAPTWVVIETLVDQSIGVIIGDVAIPAMPPNFPPSAYLMFYRCRATNSGFTDSAYSDICQVSGGF